jgi:ubiquinone/menaquinone biosynthesis C-methylase UbiE
MKLSDPTVGLKATALEQVELEGQSLDDHRAFWDRSATVDARRAISDQDTDESFETSGLRDSSRVTALLTPDGSGRVVEIGCGIGRIVQHVAPHAAEVVGVDISAEMVQQAQARLSHLPTARFLVGNGYDLGDLPDDTYDLVYSYYVLQHMPKTTVYNYFRETLRVLKPGGAFSFQLPNILDTDQFLQFNHFTQPYFVTHPYPMHFYTPVEIVSLLVRAGYWVESIDDVTMVVARYTGTAGTGPAVHVQTVELGGSTPAFTSAGGARSANGAADPRAHALLDRGWVAARRGARIARGAARRGKALVRAPRSR